MTHLENSGFRACRHQQLRRESIIQYLLHISINAGEFFGHLRKLAPHFLQSSVSTSIQISQPARTHLAANKEGLEVGPRALNITQSSNNVRDVRQRALPMSNLGPEVLHVTRSTHALTASDHEAVTESEQQGTNPPEWPAGSPPTLQSLPRISSRAAPTHTSPCTHTHPRALTRIPVR